MHIKYRFTFFVYTYILNIFLCSHFMYYILHILYFLNILYEYIYRQYHNIYMHSDHFPTSLFDTSSHQLVQPLLFRDYLHSFSHKISWKKCRRKVIFRSQDIQIFVFLTISRYSKSVTSWWLLVHETGCIFKYIFRPHLERLMNSPNSVNR